jgi:DNA repair exonuclease SbcCD nuclease subunit
LLNDDAFAALDQIENLAIMRGVSEVILGGDVYDSVNPSGEAINRVASFVARLKSVGILTYYIEGNHDRINKNPFLSDKHYEEHRLLSSIGAIPLGTRELGGLVYHGIDYCPVQKLHEQLNEIPECDVLCLHAGFQHLLGFENAYDIRMDDIPVEVRKLVLVGHVHTMDKRLTPNGVMVASSGSTWPWRLTEVDKLHGVFIVHENAGLDYHALACRQYFDITEEKDIVEAQEEQHVLPPVLFYDPRVLSNIDPNKYEGVKLIARGSTEVEQVEEIKEDVASNLQEAVEVGVPKKEYPTENAFLRGLLDSSDPEGFIDSDLRERKVTFKESA